VSRLSRYVFREVLGPTVVAFLAYTGFMLLRAVVQFSDLVLQSDVPASDVGCVLAFSVPHIVVLTLPIAFLLGLLIGVGRMSADSELIALRASGIDLLRLYGPIGLLATLTCAATLALMTLVVPRTNQMLYAMKLRLSSFAITQRIQPGIFSPEIFGVRIYVEEASADRTELKRLIVSDHSDPSDRGRLTLAQRGRLELEEEEGRLWLRLEDAVTYHVAQDPRRDDLTGFGSQRMLIEDTNPKELAPDQRFEKQIRELTLPQLLQRARSQARTEPERRVAWVEIHKKFSLPAACLVFGLIGLPLGIVNRRGGRAAGFAISVAIVLGYYVLLASGEARAIEGGMRPWLAMWLPNLLLLVFGAFALLRVRADRPFLPTFRLPSRFDPEPPAIAAAAAPAARRIGWRLRSILLVDRYVAGRFLRVFALVVASILVIYVLIDYMEINDDIARNHPGSAVVLRYVQARLAPILFDILPFAFLVGALITVASLVRSSETTALLSHGVSLHRTAAPLLVMAVLMGGALFLFGERVVPRAATEADRLRRTILGHPDRENQGAGNLWFRGKGGRFFAADLYDAATKDITSLSVFELDETTFRIRRRVEAAHATLIPGRGILGQDGWTRTYSDNGDSLFLRHEGVFLVEAPEASADFVGARSDPHEMTTAQLAKFIAARRQAGADIAALATGLHQKIAVAASALILTLVGLPFAFRFGKSGAVAGIGVALLLGLAYLFVSQLLANFGERGALPPLLAAWGANVFFGLGAGYGLLGVRT
jgi:LPS export ABC transporter permease LptF/LPS export ABC transporter permease LptG